MLLPHFCLPRREREPWEASDGAVHMLEQLALQGATMPLPAALDLVLELLPAVADLAACRNFRKACALRETIWKSLPSIARSLGESLQQTFDLH